MKKKLLLLTLFVGSLALTAAADPIYGKKKSSGDAVEQGKMLVDVYYGYNSLISMFIRAYAKDVNSANAYSNNGGSLSDGEYKYSGTGIIGGRFEYLLTDHIGLSFSAMYEKINLTYMVVDYPNIYTENMAFTRIGALFGFNLHFLTQEHLDPYFVTGLSYQLYTEKYTTTGIKTDNSNEYVIPFPLGARLGLGARYFFTDNIGVRLEAGVGSGGLIEGGLALKF